MANIINQLAPEILCLLPMQAATPTWILHW